MRYERRDFSVALAILAVASIIYGAYLLFVWIIENCERWGGCS
jgi:hypothetical protein